ncbi:MAG: hypothetical protein ACYTGX_06360 [Planctomycetota bacterium]
MGVILSSRTPMTIPAGLAQACAGLPEFGPASKMLRLARWWNMWVGAAVALVAASLMATFIARIQLLGDDVTAERLVMLAVALLLVVAGAVVWFLGVRLPAVVHRAPRKLRSRLALAAGGNAILLIPLLFFLLLWMLDFTGTVAGPAMPLHVSLITAGAMATPAVGVFLNGFPWLRLGRAYDNAVADYVPEAA